MEIRGTLQTTSLPDLIRWLSETKQTGTLVFQIGPIRKKLFFRDGELISAASSDPREFLGQFLLRKGWIAEGQLIKALEEQMQSGRMLGLILVEKGWLTEQQLKEALREKACDTIYSLFIAEDATFEFLPGELPTYEMIPIGLPVHAIVMEGVYRKDEWQRVQQTFPAMERTILRRVEGVPMPSEMKQDWIVQRVYRTINGRRSLGEIALMLYELDFDVMRIALRLYEHGLVEIVGEVTTTDESARTQLPLEMLIEACQTKLREDRIVEAIRMMEFIERHYADVTSEVETLRTLVYRKVMEQFLQEFPLTAVPRLKVSMDELMQFRLDPMTGFLATRINGIYDIKTLKNLVPVPEERFYVMLKRLMDLGLVEIQRPTQ